METQYNSHQSLKAHLVRATHQWCTDMGYTPYMVVLVDSSVRVPPAYVQNHTIVLNTSYESTNRLEFTEHFIEFQARFNGVVYTVGFPYNRVLKVYARETQAGYDAIDAELVELINRLEQGEELPQPEGEEPTLQPLQPAVKPVQLHTTTPTDGAEGGKKPSRKTTLKRIK